MDALAESNVAGALADSLPSEGYTPVNERVSVSESDYENTAVLVALVSVLSLGAVNYLSK